MNNTAFTPSTIGSRTFRIPLYQRPYAWEESQVRQLLDDLHETFIDTPDAHYYIGILSVAETSDDKARVDLIDGQQRITTLMLIGKAARGLWSGWEAFLDADRLDLYGRKGDRDYLHGDIETECNPRMLATVRVARNFFETNATPSFAQYIYEHAAFFLAEVPSGYSLMDKNQQFVRMNNRGKQLEKHEILEVQLLSTIVDPAERTKAFNGWNYMAGCLAELGIDQNDKTQLLASILESSGDQAEPHGGETFETSIVTIPEFLLIALARYRGKDDVSFNTDKLLETFTVLKGDANAIGAFMDVLNKQVALLRAFFIFLSKGCGYVLGKTEKDEESSFDFEDGSNGKKRLIAVQSFLHVSTVPHHWLIPAFNWCLQFLNKKIGAEQFVQKLEEIDNDLIRDGVRELSSINELKDLNYGNVTHYWYYRLDYELWNRFEGPPMPDDIWSKLRHDKETNEVVRKLIRDFRFRSGGSVEHINPQHPIEGNKSGEKPDHSFGNLALISSSRNAKFNNNPPEGKKDIILRSCYAESLKMLHFLWCNPDASREGEIMFNILKKIRETIYTD